jgi:predicted glycosyltransferase
MPHSMIWTFVRRHEQLEVRREEAADGRHVLVVTGGDAAGSTVFSDMAALVQQQSRLELMLIGSGWSLASFEPERRSLADRRATKRDTADRRQRWWTDPEARRRDE